MAIQGSEFKQALRNWASGVTVVTTKSDSFGYQGMTVSAFSSVSVDPPQILICVNQAVSTAKGICESKVFAVNILTLEQEAVSNLFADPASYADRFTTVPWEEGGTGSPLLQESLASLDCRVVKKFTSGTHWIVIGEVLQTELRQGEPLLYFNGGYRQLG
ncbi:MAG: flavin reductase family protein [Gammaproteobacteria bacterium]